MSINVRRYKMLSDFPRVSQFLRENFGKYYENGSMTQPHWEYIHTHPFFNYKLTHRFGIWEEDGQIVAVAVYEMNPGECYLNTKPGYKHLIPQMIEYAEKELSKSEQGIRTLEFWALDHEKEFIEALINKGYEKVWEDLINIYPYTKGFAETILPEGYSMISLEDENDIQKIHTALWKGFDHDDNPDDDLDCRLHMQSAPHFRKDLTIIIKSPDNCYACFCGMWLDGFNDFAYLEPLATVPEYRKKGLARAALMESMRRTSTFGASYCIGGANSFYTKIGFTTICKDAKWKKEWRA